MLATAERFLERHPHEDVDRPMVAVVYKGSRVYSYGHNSNKTHPLAKRMWRFVKKMYDHGREGNLSCRTHAELDALKRADGGDTILVARKTKQGEWAMAKPCNICMKILELYEIDHIYYTTDEGTLAKVR